MEKFFASPNRSMSARRMRTHAEWNVDTHMSRARFPTSSSTRSRISAAALFVNVIARIDPGWTPRCPISHAIRRVSTRVLPEPAPATTSTGDPSCSTASRWGGFRPSSSSSAVGRRRRGRLSPADPPRAASSRSAAGGAPVGAKVKKSGACSVMTVPA